MRARQLLCVLAALSIGSLSAAAEEPRDAKTEGVDVEDALEEPADPDDELDIEADDDPDDVGQEGLEPTDGTPPREEPRRHGGREGD